MQDINFSNKAPVMKFHCKPVCGRQRCFPPMYSGFQKTADKPPPKAWPHKSPLHTQGSSGTRKWKQESLRCATKSQIQRYNSRMGYSLSRTLLWGPLRHNTTRDMCDTWNPSDVPKNTAEPHEQTSTPGRKAVTFIPHAYVRGWAWKTRLSLKRGGMFQVAGSLTMVLTGSVSQHSTTR